MATAENNMSTPAENAATVRKALDESREFFNIDVDAALPALDALEAQAARVEELEAALREAEGWLTQGQGSPECHYALGIIRAALDKDTA